MSRFLTMPRFLTIFGALLGFTGGIAGAAFIAIRHAAFTEATRGRQGMFAPLLWQLSLGSGTLVITLSVLFGVLFFLLGRTLAKVERLEREASDRAADQALAAQPS